MGQALADESQPKIIELPKPEGFTGYQKLIVVVLAFLQFTVILDFMILSPLGAILIKDLSMTPVQFGSVVSAYAFAAGIAGVVAAGFADRFDRKYILLCSYCGFLLGTLLCALANSYIALLIARITAGLFGGVLGSTVFALLADLFPYQMRGRVMGIIQAAFGSSQVLGIPVGLWAANAFHWHAPFYLIVIIGAIVGVCIGFIVKPVNNHREQTNGENPFSHLWHTIKSPIHLQAFATTALLATGGFMLMPFASAFSVNNVGISLDDLPFVYIITGITALIAGPLIGRLSDQFGKFKTFMVGSFVSIIMVFVYTRLGQSSFLTLAIVNCVLFVGISARMISSQALISAVPSPKNRGSFMGISNSVQQISGGLGSIIAGWIIVIEPSGMVKHFDTVGYLVIGGSLFTLFMMSRIHLLVHKSNQMPPPH